MKKTYDLILFDLDGTLTDPGEGVIKSVQYALKKFGIEEDDLNNLKNFIGPPPLETFMKSYGFTQQEALEVRKAYNERYLPSGWKENYVYPGIVDLLENLVKMGRTLGVATSRPEDTTEKILKYFKLEKYFSVIGASPSNGIGGDKAESISKAIKEAKRKGYVVERTVLVGDTKYDVEGAHQCGIPCIGVTWGYSKEGDFEFYNTEYIVNDTEELLEILK